MTGPFVYVGIWTIKEGKVEDAKKFLTQRTELIETNEPRLIASTATSTRTPAR
jgi:hypothetical protein